MKSKFLTMKFILGALILSFICACSNSNSEEAIPDSTNCRPMAVCGIASSELLLEQAQLKDNISAFEWQANK